MKALTVQQPWAWAIIHGGKDVENRGTLWKHRGPLAIHAGLQWAPRASLTEPMQEAWARHSYADQDVQASLTRGAVIGFVDVVDIHVAQPAQHAYGNTWSAACCESVWAEHPMTDGRRHRQLTHLVLDNPQSIDPIPTVGALGLWTLPAHIEQAYHSLNGATT